MENLSRSTRRRIIVLLLILLAYGGVFIVLNCWVIETKEEVSPLILPVITKYDLPIERPTGLAFDGENLWISSAKANQICAVEPSTGTIIKRLASSIPVSWGLAWDGSHLWVADVISLRIYRVNITSGTAVFSVKAPGTMPMGLTWDGTNLWVSDSSLNKIFRVDPVNGSVLQSFKTPTPGYRPLGLTWDGTGLWIADLETSLVLRVDPSTEAVTSYYYSSGYYPAGLAWDNGYLWILDYSMDKIYKTLPGAKAYRLTRLSVPTWFWPMLGISIIPVILSILATLKPSDKGIIDSSSPAPFPASIRRKTWSLSAIALMIAVVGSIYISYELFRIVYGVTVLNQAITRRDTSSWLYMLEMLLCLYTFSYWIYYAVVKGLLPLLRRSYRKIGFS